MAEFIELPDPDGEYTDVERLRYALLAVCDAVRMIMAKVIELDEHTAEHHNIINDLGRSVGTLEALMIGGDNEAPPA
jgi:hypothetical protein